MDRSHSADFCFWSNQFQLIDEVMLRSIRSFIQLNNFFDKTMLGYVMIIGSTEYYRTYVYGERICSSVSLKHDPKRPQELEELKGKSVTQVDCGNDFFAILTSDGLVYVGSSDINWRTNQKLRILPGHYRMIACGKFHLLLLRKDNKLMAIGGNGAGEITGDYDSYETLVDTGLENVSKIACGGVNSMALTKDGKLYTWGWNEYGQLGLNDKYNRNKPSLVHFTFPNVISANSSIKDITAGVCHSLVLFDDGSVHGFGSNAFNQLGVLPNNIDQTNKPFPQKNFLIPIKIPIGNVVAIASRWSYDCTIVFTNDGSCYVWGHLNVRNFNEPTKIQRSIQSFSDASAIILQKFKQPPLTFGLTTLRNKPKIKFRDRLMETISNWFNNPQNYDFTFEIEEKRIFVQKSYLRMTSKYFEKMLSEHWCQQNSVQINSYSYDIFYAYLKMLHFGHIQINDDNLVELLDLANCYLDQGLIELCQQYIFEHINMNNCYEYCYLAAKYDLRDIDNEFYNFAQRHFPDFVTEKFRTENENIFKKFIALYDKTKK